MVKKKGGDTRIVSLRMYEPLAQVIEEIAESDNRSINSQIIELIKKGIDLRNAEIRYLASVGVRGVVAPQGADDDASKHHDASDAATSHDEKGQKGENRELA